MWWSRNQEKFEFCSSISCYPELGCFPDLKALAYQRVCLPQSTVYSPPWTTALCRLLAEALSANSRMLSDRPDAENSLFTLYFTCNSQKGALPAPRCVKRPRCADGRGCSRHAKAGGGVSGRARCTCTQRQPRCFRHRKAGFRLRKKNQLWLSYDFLHLSLIVVFCSCGAAR